MKNRPIGIFDSGLGGLTVVRSILDRLPGEDIVFLGDNARFPYGTKGNEEVRGFAREITEYLLGFGVKLVVVACNSATAAALGELQRDYDIPIVGVINPGVRAALRRSSRRRIGVIGTPLTISSGTYTSELKKLDPSVDVYGQACPEFVEFVERNELQGERIETVARGYLEPMVEEGVDAIIMGCTHYPLLEDLMIEVIGPGVTLISSAEETAAEVEDILDRLGWLKGEEGGGRLYFLTTGDAERCAEMGRRFLGPEVETVVSIDFSHHPELGSGE
jgi:glutamate racemase